MIKAKDKNGREIEFSVYGRHGDDIQIDEIYYVDGEDEVSEATVNWIQERYAEEIYEAWYMNMVDAAEYYMDAEYDR